MENFHRILGVLNGRDTDRDLFARWANSSDQIIAGDGGANALIAAGITPHLVIGDMDSVDPSKLTTDIARLHIADQNTTDCDKLLAFVSTEGAHAITLVGVEGDLPDHVIAILYSAARSDLDVRLAYRRGIGWIVKPDRARKVASHVGSRVSLLPLEPCEGVYLEGVEWPLTDANLSLRDGVSISNRTESNQVSVTIAKGAALLFLEFPSEEMPVW